MFCLHKKENQRLISICLGMAQNGSSSFWDGWILGMSHSLGVALAPTQGGGRGECDPRVGVNVTQPRFAWQAQ